jgi:UDP-N-acetylglucosamine 4,6-dehydratase
MSVFDGKVILVTGGTGSFGNKFAEVMLREHSPKTIRILSRGELLQQQMQEKFNTKTLRFLIGDVRDRDRVYRAMDGVDIVIHAAALKQVPACEYNPLEAIRTNVDGAVNIIDAAIDHDVERILAISSDKAVHPVNLYGATKMVSEKLFVQANVFVHDNGNPRFSCVRYGNVVGSRGSVIPAFMEQRKMHALKITDPRMTRFWITLEQGVQFVIGSVEKMVGGEIFIPKIPSTKVTDLAEVMAPEARISTIGIRPGEKLHEVLITEDEARHSMEFKDSFIIEPEFSFWVRSWGVKDGKALPDGFRYTSDNNTKFLTRTEISSMLKKEGFL